MMHDKERGPILFPFIWVVPHLTPVDLIRFQFYLEIVLLIEGGSVWTAKQWSIREDLLPFRSSWFEINCSSIKERIWIDFSAETCRWLFEGSPPVVIHHEYNPKHFKLIVPLCIHFLVSKRWHFFLVTLFNATQLHWDLSLDEVVFLERCFVQTKNHPISFSMHITSLLFDWLTQQMSHILMTLKSKAREGIKMQWRVAVHVQSSL